MPDGATPESHIVAGAWCFAGKERHFPGWDDPSHPKGRFFPLPPDPYSDGEAIAEAARAANGEAFRLTRLLGPRCFSHQEGGGPHSEAFYQMALTPFLLLAVHMLAERQKRVLDLLDSYGRESIRVNLLPADMPFSFIDSLDFMLHGVQDIRFNHYIYSRILEKTAPENWSLQYTPVAVPLHQAAPKARCRTIDSCKRFLRSVLRDLPFPRYKGFSLLQSIAFSLAVLGNTRKNTDASIDFSRYCDSPLHWLFPAETLIERCIPLAMQNHIFTVHAAKASSSPGPFRGMTPAYTQDDAYRLRLAALRARGYRLFSVQHGANYGNLLSVGGIPVEYGQHVFFTWGWGGHEGIPVNARPLPHPALCAIADKHRETRNSLILVGTEMSTFSYRLKSRPQSGALPEYRRSKVTFLRAIGKYFDKQPVSELCIDGHCKERTGGEKPELLYRPYFKVAGGLDDGDYIRRTIPGVRLCEGDLNSHMLSCRLLALDHYGTTMHMALAANIPLVAFWKAGDWVMESNTERALEPLREAGILHDSAESAASLAIRVWGDIASWWHTDKVQSARRHWLKRYAQVYTNKGTVYTKTQLARLWFKALREY